MRSTFPITLAAVALLATSAGASTAGSADQFLARAERLLGKGPGALFDPDYKRLSAEGTAAGDSIRLEREAAERAHRPILYCSPKPRARLGNLEFVRALRAIPPGQRRQMSLRAAMLQVLEKKYPCPSRG
jgi:hypothetical protein